MISFVSLLGANGRALLALGHNRINLYVNAGIGFSNVLLNLVLIPRYGGLGAATATALSLVVRDIVFSLVLYRRGRIYALTITTLQAVAGAMLVSVVGYLLFVQIVPVTFLTALAWGPAFVVVYIPILIVSGGIESEDERMVSLVEERVGIELTQVRSVVSRLQG